MFGGMGTAAGVAVDEETALTYSPFWAGVSYISMDVAKLPLGVFRRLDRGREKAENHPLHHLLHDAPNPEMTAVSFRSALQGHLLTWGNAYANIVRDGYGRVIELWPLRPDRMTPPVRDENGRLVYVYTLPTGEQRKLYRDEVLHIPGFGYDGIQGYGVVTLARESIGLGLATERYGARFFGSGARPGGVLKHPGRLSDAAYQRLRKDFESMHQGLENSHRLAILEEGMEYQQVGLPPEDAQFLQTRKHQITDIARWLRIPLQKLHEHDKASSYASAEQFSQDYVNDTLLPWCVIWEQNLALQLMTPLERKRYFFKHNMTALLRGDSTSRANYYAKLFGVGAYSINMILELEDQNPIGPAGDIHFVPLNMIPVDQALTLSVQDRATLLAAMKGGEGDREGKPVLEVQGLGHEPEGGGTATLRAD